MNIENIVTNIILSFPTDLGRYEKLLRLLEKKKITYIKKDDEKGANNIWKLEQIIKIISLYIESFYLLKNKKHYDAWVKFEQIDNLIFFLKKNFTIINDKLFFIEKTIFNYRVLFPYRIFASVEYIVKSAICSICGTKLSLRSTCEHHRGIVYKGFLCVRIIKDFEVTGCSLVECPFDKTCVVFLSDENGNKIDHYNYSHIDFVVSHLDSPFENWELKTRKKLVKIEDLPNLQDENLCPCKSKKKFMDCCKNKGEVLIEDLCPVLPYKEGISKSMNAVIATTKDIKGKMRSGEIKILSPQLHTDIFHEDSFKNALLSFKKELRLENNQSKH